MIHRGKQQGKPGATRIPLRSVFPSRMRRAYGRSVLAAVFLSVFLRGNADAGANANPDFRLGCNFWCIGWGNSHGGGPAFNYFAKGVDWKTTTDPWNPTFIAELKESKMACLRYMDWGITNGNLTETWSQRIPKTANHNDVENIIPNSSGDIWSSYGVAYEWMIDLCNKINADMWVCIPHRADANYSTQLATLIKDLLKPNLKVYVEYTNEHWNGMFEQYRWLRGRGNVPGYPAAISWRGRTVWGDGGVGDCTWTEYVYYACKVVDGFNKVFGLDNPRLVRVLAGSYYDDITKDYNPLCDWHMACLADARVNPNGVKFDVYAVAPYYGDHGQCTEAEMRRALAEDVELIKHVKYSLEGSGMKLVGYEGGPDNYGCQDICQAAFQEQLTVDGLNAYAKSFEGVLCWYTFNGGGPWGFKAQVGDSASVSPRWRGLMKWVAAQPQLGARPAEPSRPPALSRHDRSPDCNLLGQPLPTVTARQSASVRVTQDNGVVKGLSVRTSR